jgi:NADH-quinone oxidoreductase subunit A
MSEFPLVGYILLFLAVGVGFIVVNLLAGKLIRPNRPQSEKATIYECGEPTIGSAWVQFDLRFYVVALLFVIFDVEVAFFFPWAVIFGQATQVAQVQQAPEAGSPAEAEYLHRVRDLSPPAADREKLPAVGSVEENAKSASRMAWFAMFDILVFFGVLLVGFAYLWRRGDLQWVRSISTDAAAPIPKIQTSAPSQLTGAGS